MASQDNVRQALLTNVLADLAPFLDTREEVRDKCHAEAEHGPVSAQILVDSLFKKWVDESEKAETVAMLTFLEANHLSREWRMPSSLKFDGDFAVIWGEFKRELDNFLHDGKDLLVDSEFEYFGWGKVGPGAAQLANSPSFYGKMGSSTFTATSAALYAKYRDYCVDFPLWAQMENHRRANYEDLVVVTGSSISFAPKTAVTARLIGTEPSLNMFAQLGLCNLIERRMSDKWNLSLEDQPEINRLLTGYGSLTGEFATIDLSSASDRISVELCRAALPQWFFETLCELRSSTATSKHYGLSVELGMISTMGNGFTFPLMTCILSCAIRACYRSLGIPIRDNRQQGAGVDLNTGRRLLADVQPGNWGVFGDDIIVVTEAYHVVVGFLEALGLQVNSSKSFNKGPFRESCGHDYFRGRNVRGVYLKRLTSRQDIAVAINRLNEWSARTGILLRSAVQGLYRLLRRPLLVPYAESDDAGVRVPSSIFKGVVRREDKYRFKACYECDESKPAKVRFGDGVLVTPNGCKRMKYNGAAALLALLLGEIRNGSLIVRQTNGGGRYRRKWRVTPNWDYMPSSLWVNPRDDWRQWETAVWFNLNS